MEFKIASCSCADETGNSHRFHYFLTVDAIQSGNFFCENYGVRIQEENGGETTISSITTSATRIDELLTCLVEHQVGPAGLSDVVADWL
jgi:hypothetical protein